MASLNLSSIPLDYSIPYSDTVHFVNKNKSLKCVVCDRVGNNSKQLLCGHRICKEHIDSAPKEKCITCSICKEESPKDQIFPDISGRREILAADVYCINKEVGCKEVVQLRNLKKHLETCKYNPNECINAGKGCSTKLPYEEMIKHLEKDCHYQPEVCKHCTEQIMRNELKNHVDNACPSVQLHCRFNCGIKPLFRPKMIKHEQVCKKRRRCCIFHDAGCIFEDVDSEVDKHEANNVAFHLEMTTKKTMDIENQLRQQIEKRKEETRILVDNSQVAGISKEEKEMLKKEQQINRKAVQELKLLLAGMGEKNITLLRKIEDLCSKAIIEQVKGEITQLKDGYQQISEKVTCIERSGPTGGNGARNGLNAETTRRFEQQLALYDTRLSELDLRFQLMETASYDGKLMWKIRDYSRRKQEAVSGRTLSLFSQPFYSSRNGYKMCGRIYLNGDGEGKGTHVSFFFVIMRGDFDALLQWPFKAKVSLMLLSQDGTSPNICDTFEPQPTSSSFRKPQSEMNVASGIPKYISHQMLEKPAYLRDDTIFLMIKIDRSGLTDI